jgi:hypothetical protein
MSDDNTYYILMHNLRANSSSLLLEKTFKRDSNN